MGDIMDFNNKNVLICGMGKSGISAAKLLLRYSANITLQDYKKEYELKNELKEIKDLDINILTGKNPDDIVLNMDLIVLSPGIPTNLNFIKMGKEAGIKIIGEVELAYYFIKGKIIGITGTNGKTTTTSILGDMVSRYSKKTYIVGNIGEPITNKADEMDEDSICVCELSSFQLETIDKFKPYIGAVLNISPDHLDRHITFTDYIHSKENIYKNQTEKDFLILNYDDEFCRKMVPKTKSKVLYFSSKEEVEGIYLKDEYIYINYSNINEKILNIKDIKLVGTHNVENIMVTILIGHLLNIPKDIIRESIVEFKAVEHRMEYVETINNIDFYNDSKGTNPESTIRAIQSVEKPIILIAGGYDKGTSYSKLVENFKDKVKLVVLIGETAKRIENEAKQIGFTNTIRVDSLKDAVNISYENGESGDIILLSPASASWGMFENYEIRGNEFKKYVNELKV